VYEPTSLTLIRVRSRVTDATWEQRVEQASRDERAIKRILAEEAKGRSLNEAIAKVLPANRRSWALRRIPRYREQGFEALIDARTPREADVSFACRQAVQAAREATPGSWWMRRWRSCASSTLRRCRQHRPSSVSSRGSRS
jgi:hypothetical protein